MALRAGEVYWAFADKRRPVVIISREELNRGEYVVVVPLTTAQLEVRRRLPNCALIDTAPGLKKCVAQGEMVSSLLRSDLIGAEEGPVVILDGEIMREIVRAVGYMMLADCEPA